MVFNPRDQVIDESLFPCQDCSTSEFGNIKDDDILSNMHEARCLGFTIRAFVDVHHAGDTITRLTRTGFLVYLNSSPIY